MCLEVTKYYIKCVRKSQNSKCVCMSQNSHIQSPCDGGTQMSFDNGLRWSLLVPGGFHVKKISWNLVKNS